MEIQRYIRYGLSLGLTFIFLLHVAGLPSIPFFEDLEKQFYDARLNLTLPESAEQDVVIIDFDDKSLSEIGRWPWNRNIMADIVDQLFDHYGISVLGFDIVFAEPDIDEGGKLLESLSKTELRHNDSFIHEYQRALPKLLRDDRFAESLKGRNTIMGFVLDTGSNLGTLPSPVAELGEETNRKLDLIKPKGHTANLELLQESAKTGGFFDNPLIDGDGVFRRVPLLQEYDGRLYESLALAIARTYLGSPQIELFVEASTDGSQLFLEGLDIGDTHIPTDGKAGILVPYIGTQKSFRYVPATDVLHGRIDRSALQGKIAVFGTSAPGLLDMRTTPIDTVFPGVEVHANIIQGILDGRVMQRPGYSIGYEFMIVLLLGIALTFVLPQMSPLLSSMSSIGLIVLLVVFNLYMWTSHQLVFPLATPLVLVILLFTLNMTYGFFIESRGKRQLAHLFGQYVPPELVEEMSSKQNEINLDGEMREMSVLFSDVRGFTTISEGMEPVELTRFINAFLTPITAIIHGERGTIDKYMGDAVMAFWGAPLHDDKHALHALTAAMKMIERMNTLTLEFQERGWPPIQVGVGINTGMMNVGNKGSEFRVDYTILGDAVNLGSRLEGLTKNYGVDIIVGEATRDAVPEYEYRELDRVRVKGKIEPVSIYEPIGLSASLDGDTRLALTNYHRALRYYREQNWDDAEKTFSDLLSSDSPLNIYEIYLQRILAYRTSPPPADWDGVFTHTSK